MSLEEFEGDLDPDVVAEGIEEHEATPNFEQDTKRALDIKSEIAAHIKAHDEFEERNPTHSSEKMSKSAEILAPAYPLRDELKALRETHSSKLRDLERERELLRAAQDSSGLNADQKERLIEISEKLLSPFEIPKFGFNK